MNATLKFKLENKIPELIDNMVKAYPPAELPKYNLRIEYWDINPATGEKRIYSVDRWVIDEEDLFDHIKKAKRLNDATISVESTKVVVERVRYDGMRGNTATYTPEVA